MFIHYIKVFFLFISFFYSIGVQARLSFEKMPITKHPTPASYTESQLTEEIKMPPIQKNELSQDTEINSKKSFFNTFIEGLKKIVHRIVLFFKKAEEFILSFFTKKISEINLKDFPASYISSDVSEDIAEEKTITEPSRNVTDVKATRFEDNDPLFSEKERIRKEIDRIKRIRSIEKNY